MTFSIETYTVSRNVRRLDGGKFDLSNGRSRLAIYKSPPPQMHERLVRINKDPGKKDSWVVVEQPGKFYLAGPMRGYPLFNFPAFLMAARVLTARGFEIVSPAEKDLEAGFDPSRPVEGQNFDIGAAFRWDFEAVVKARGIILLPGWENSTGAKAERLVAALSELEVYQLDERYNLIEAPEATYELTWTPKVPTAV